MLYPSVQLNYIFFTFILVNISNILSTGLNEDSNQFNSATTHYSDDVIDLQPAFSNKENNQNKQKELYKSNTKSGYQQDSNNFDNSGLQVSNTSHLLRPLDSGKNQDYDSTANEKVAPSQ
uniref:Uncharacterized protein n=1 Tax=Cuerna arida TaxID=1464854 RepID=A0A1B6FTJ3_9HEMI